MTAHEPPQEADVIAVVEDACFTRDGHVWRNLYDGMEWQWQDLVKEGATIYYTEETVRELKRVVMQLAEKILALGQDLEWERHH